MIDSSAYILSKQHTNESLNGLGALKGANCTISSIVKQNGQNIVTFEWTGNDGTKQSSVMIVNEGTKIGNYTAGESYSTGDFVVYSSSLYRCTVSHESTASFNVANWEPLGTSGGDSDSNYDIVESSTYLPQGFTSEDRKMYFSMSDKAFWLWNGTNWELQNTGKTQFSVSDENLRVN